MFFSQDMKLQPVQNVQPTFQKQDDDEFEEAEITSRGSEPIANSNLILK